MLIKKGQKFQVVGVNRNSHSYMVGVTYEATMDDFGNGIQGKDNNNQRGNTITEENYKIVGTTRDEITKELGTLEEKYMSAVTRLQAQLAYLDETKKEEYDETDYKCYQAIKSLNSASSDLEKAMLISKLIKGEL